MTVGRSYAESVAALSLLIPLPRRTELLNLIYSSVSVTAISAAQKLNEWVGNFDQAAEPSNAFAERGRRPRPCRQSPRSFWGDFQSTVALRDRPALKGDAHKADVTERGSLRIHK